MKRMMLTLARQSRSRLRLMASIGVGVGLFGLMPSHWPVAVSTRGLLAWNSAVMLYLILDFWVIATSSIETMRLRAFRQDEGQKTVLFLTACAVVASLLAIVVESSAIKEMTGLEKNLHVTLIALTVGCSWVFMHLMFGLHYAHDYYLNIRRGQPPGLEFPGESTPDYWDFLYFAAIIGTSGQTADVTFTSKLMRRTGLFHCVMAYFYNTTVLALTINLVAGLV